MPRTTYQECRRKIEQIRNNLQWAASHAAAIEQEYSPTHPMIAHQAEQLAMACMELQKGCDIVLHDLIHR